MDEVRRRERGRLENVVYYNLESEKELIEFSGACDGQISRDVWSLIEDEKGGVGLKKKDIERKRWMADVDGEPRGRDCVV